MIFDRQQYEQTLLNLSQSEALRALPLHVFETIPSTNQKLWQLIDQGEKLPLAAIASTQTAGRGQWERQWHSPTGGLYLSLALPMQISATDAAHITIFSAGGVAQALRNYDIPVFIKWLNDLVLEGCKLGGIKSETRTQRGYINQTVIGIGINWKNEVPAVGINLQSFLSQGGTSAIDSLETLAAITLHGLWNGYQRYLSAGIENLLASYCQLLSNQGQTVVVKGCPGVVVGVTSGGKLRVRLRSSGAATEICLPPGTISLGYPDAGKSSKSHL